MVVCLGELLLRLKSPGKSRLLQVPSLETSFGGSEANTAALLHFLGHPTAFFTVLPDNELGRAALGYLRQLGVDTSSIALGTGRMGLYFLEEGALGRPSRVLYDRERSAFAQVAPEWAPPFPEMANWLHLSGITPALSERAMRWSVSCVERAARNNLRLSLDLNHRTKLWKWGQPSQKVLPQFLQYMEVVISNESDLFSALGQPFETIDPEDPKPSLLRNAERLFEAYPTVKALAVSLRLSRSADDNSWSGALVLREGTVHLSPTYPLAPIVDRVGAGDAFGAGVIAGFLEGLSPEDTVKLAAALGAIKHSIPGDICLITRAEAESFLRDQSGRISR